MQAPTLCLVVDISMKINPESVGWLGASRSNSLVTAGCLSGQAAAICLGSSGCRWLPAAVERQAGAAAG